MGGSAPAPSIPQEADRPIRLRVLGTFELSVRGVEVDHAAWRRASAERLVKLIAVAPDHRVSRELAAETLWPGAAPDSSRVNLRKALHFARRAMAIPGAIVSDGELVRLNASLVDLDLDRLLHALDAVGRGPTARIGPSAEALATILELGGHMLLPEDPYDDWLAPVRESLYGRWREVAMDSARDAAASDRRAEAHAVLDRVLARDPTDEEAHRLEIELYAAEGRFHAVRRQFERCRRALAAALEVGPSADTEATYRRAEQASQGQRIASARPRLVARRRELELAGPALDRAAAGRLGAVVVRGPAGIGKTRLLEELREHARQVGFRELWWHAVEATRPIAFAPFAVRLADEVTAVDLETWDEPARSALAALLPSLNDVPRLAFADRSALQIGLVGALARLARSAPRLIAIDDLPSLDESSMELIGSVATALDGEPVLVALTYRDEEPLSERARELLDALRRSGSVEVRLGPLDERDIEPLVVGHLGGNLVGSSLAGELFARSEGNPLFCIELAQEARDRGTVVLQHGRWDLIPGRSLEGAPDTVRQVVAARSNALPAGSVELLRVAAELGPEIRYDTLAAVMRTLPQGLIAALDAALASGLLVERSGGYAFGHPLYRAAIEAGSGLARRADTHLAIACALAGLDGAATDGAVDLAAAVDRSADPSQVAEHALQAYGLGRTDAGRLAIGFGLAAARRARALFDRVAAVSLLERSLDAWRRMPNRAALPLDASDAYASLAELRLADGADAEAETSFRSAIAAARDADELAAAYDRYSSLPLRHGNYEAIISLCDEGLTRLPGDAEAPRAILRQRIGYCHLRMRRLDAAVVEFEAAIPVLEAAGKLEYAAFGLDLLGVTLAFAGRAEDGLVSLERALAIAVEHPELRLAYVHAELGGVLTQLGRAGQARPHFARALELADQMGEWYEEAVAAWLAAEAEDALGDLEAARQLRSRELALLSRIGGNPHHEALAHAHLAHLARLLGDPATEEREAARARELAGSDPETGYAARIEAALSVASWSDLQAY